MKKRNPEPRMVTPEQLTACPAGAKVIPLTKGWVAFVDDGEYERLARFNWYTINPGRGATKATGYAARSVRINGKKKMLLMHREILGARRGEYVDHRFYRNAEKIVDNRRENLRLCTRSENNRNTSKRSHAKSSQMKGVRRLRAGGWVARIVVDRKEIHLGCFPTELEAALAYDAAARHHFGEFARLNLPDHSAHLSLETLIANGRSREASQPWGG